MIPCGEGSPHATSRLTPQLTQSNLLHCWRPDAVTKHHTTISVSTLARALARLPELSALCHIEHVTSGCGLVVRLAAGQQLSLWLVMQRNAAIATGVVYLSLAVAAVIVVSEMWRYDLATSGYPCKPARRHARSVHACAELRSRSEAVWVQSCVVFCAMPHRPSLLSWYSPATNAQCLAQARTLTGRQCDD